MTTAHIPDAAWQHSPGFRRVVKALTDGESRPMIVGGAVRDTVLGINVADIDLATPLTPDTVIDRLEHAGIKAIPTGIDHGTITAIADSQTVEVTTLRRDVSTDGRRATVAFSTNWREDADRRDFTFNALYADPETGAIMDFHNGISDLENGRVRFIGAPSARIAEDHLRILRFFRFHARFGNSSPDAEALAACQAAASSLMALSRERIADELLKLLALPNPVPTIAIMFQSDIFAGFLPELTNESIMICKRLIVREQRVGVIADANRRLSAMLPRNSASAEKVAARLKLSKRMRQDMVCRAQQCDTSPENALALAYHSGSELARDNILLWGDDADWVSAYDRLAGWIVPQFPIKGGELIVKGLPAGPLVAKTLQHIERQWVNSGFPDAAALKAMVDQTVADTLSIKKA